MSADTTLTCRDCGQAFTFTSGEQDFYAARGYSEPGRCPDCRAARKAERGGGGGGGGSSAKAAKRTVPVVKGPPITPPASRLASHPVPERIPTSVIILLVVLGLGLLGGLLAAASGVKLPMPVVRAVDRVFPRRA
jgi:hypothetical protein